VISNFESIVIVFGIDVKGNVNEWNEKTAEITGFSKDEAFNKPLGEFYTVR
jgi:PAS domain S-box-containing protein